MLGFLRGPLLGVIMVLLFVCNTLFWALPVYFFSLLKLVTPKGAARRQVSRWADASAQSWIGLNKLFSDLLLPTRVEIQGVERLDRHGQYLVCSNHQTWNDIHVLQTAFYGKLPFFKFFLKQQLIWVPILGLAWWGLDFPFMKRYTAAQVAKNPALKGKDIETTRKTCEKYEGLPVAIFNFLEGTRFTQAKHDQQRSPYRHLLKPKAGGLAFTLAAMGERLNAMVDVTIVYRDGAKTFWQYLCGQVGAVVVDVRTRPIPLEFCRGDYEGDAAFRKRIQDWVSAVWAEKDARIDTLLASS